MTDDDLCGQCEHPFNPHVMIAMDGNPEKGGIMLCPHPECKCYSTWSCNGDPKPLVILTEDELNELRATVQMGLLP